MSPLPSPWIRPALSGDGAPTCDGPGAADPLPAGPLPAGPGPAVAAPPLVAVMLALARLAAMVLAVVSLLTGGRRPGRTLHRIERLERALVQRRAGCPGPGGRPCVGTG